MLPVEELISAGIHDSRNDLLKALWGAVDAYNSTSSVASKIAKFETLSGRSSQPKVMALQKVMRCAGTYLTSRPPTKTKTSNDRWSAIANLAAAVQKEAEALNIKLVNGPADMRNTSESKPNAWLEVMDPMHREMTSLSATYENWLADPAAIANRQCFWEYEEAAVEPDKQKWPEFEERILYDTAARWRAEFRNGLLVDSHGKSIDTAGDESFHSKDKGWGIYVCDTLQRFFVSRHSNEKPGEWIRHTTLAAGAPVSAAGEIVVIAGKIRAISNETGHYRVPYRQFVQFLSHSTDIPGDAIVRAVIVERDSAAEGFALCRDVRASSSDPLRKGLWKDSEWAAGKVPQVDWPGNKLQDREPFV